MSLKATKSLFICVCLAQCPPSYPPSDSHALTLPIQCQEEPFTKQQNQLNFPHLNSFQRLNSIMGNQHSQSFGKTNPPMDRLSSSGSDDERFSDSTKRSARHMAVTAANPHLSNKAADPRSPNMKRTPLAQRRNIDQNRMALEVPLQRKPLNLFDPRSPSAPRTPVPQ
eukprot:3027569-Rhodomonas_salina.2